jgi:protein-S-isoprenylcysteine O-methyltransferase Ste14
MDSSLVKGVYGPLLRLHNFLMYDFESWNYLKLRHIVNLQKGGTLFFVLWLMSCFNNYSLGCWLYLGLHGTYGFVWLIKDYAFADKAFDVYTSFVAIATTFGILALYWTLPVMQVAGFGIQDPSPLRIAVCIALFGLGVTLMIGADAQKTFTLRHFKGLISDGLFTYTRNPNYLGEVMIYLSFAVCIGRIQAYAILVSVWSVLFMTRMYAKDLSLATKKGWATYQQRSWLLLPKLIPRSDWVTAALYSGLVWATWQYISLIS